MKNSSIISEAFQNAPGIHRLLPSSPGWGLGGGEALAGEGGSILNLVRTKLVISADNRNLSVILS